MLGSLQWNVVAAFWDDLKAPLWRCIGLCSADFQAWSAVIRARYDDDGTRKC